jgi:hypothetical protein
MSFEDFRSAGKFRDLVNRVGPDKALEAVGADNTLSLMTVADWVSHHIDHLNGLAKNTVADYRTYLRIDIHPDVSHCQPGCGNIAPTDQNVAHIEDAIMRHEAEIASPTTPIPLQGRLKQRVSALQNIVNEHRNKQQTEPAHILTKNLG